MTLYYLIWILYDFIWFWEDYKARLKNVFGHFSRFSVISDTFEPGIRVLIFKRWILLQREILEAHFWTQTQILHVNFSKFQIQDFPFFSRERPAKGSFLVGLPLGPSCLSREGPPGCRWNAVVEKTYKNLWFSSVSGQTWIIRESVNHLENFNIREKWDIWKFGGSRNFRLNVNNLGKRS